MHDVDLDYYSAESTLRVGESSFDYEPAIRQTDKGVYIGFLCLASEPMDATSDDEDVKRVADIVVIRTTTWVDMKATFRQFGHYAPPFSSIGYTLK